MADNRRNRPEYSDDADVPKQNEPSDPLAELARLIGQSDPFTDANRQERRPLDSFRADDRPAPEWLSRPSSPARDDYDPRPAPRYADQAPRYQDEDHDDGAEHQPDHESDAASGYPDETEGTPATAYRADNRYRVAPPPPADYDDDGYYAEDGHIPPHGEENYAAPARRRGGLVTIAAVIGLAVIGTAGAFAYRSFTTPSAGPTNPPIIKADATPAKIVPPTSTAAADALNKPFQDRVGGGAERVVPREEQPVSLPMPPRPTVAQPQTAFAPVPGASNAAPLVAPPAAPNPSTNEPKRVRTMTIRQDSMAAADPAQPAPQAAAPARAPAAKQQTAPMAIAPPSEAAPSARSKVAARTPPAQAAGGAYVVQVSAQKTEEEAKASYQALQQKYPSVLSGRDANIRRADLGDKGVYYRAQVGPFANAEAANTFCTNLKNAGGQCIVQKN